VSIWSGFSVFGQNWDQNRGTPVLGFEKPEPGTGVPVTGWFRFAPGPITSFLKFFFFFLTYFRY
jgi:TRAP-type C4-dicarboxylate transport system permease small subunit